MLKISLFLFLVVRCGCFHFLSELVLARLELVGSGFMNMRKETSEFVGSIFADNPKFGLSNRIGQFGSPDRLEPNDSVYPIIHHHISSYHHDRMIII